MAYLVASYHWGRVLLDNAAETKVCQSDSRVMPQVPIYLQNYPTDTRKLNYIKSAERIYKQNIRDR